MEGVSNGFFDDYPDVDRRSCRLLGPTALITQGLMGVLVIASLVYKRHRESPKRPWRIWLFDVSKQIIGQLFVHGVNVLISGVVAHLSSGNACVLYFLNILIDTTIGVGVIYFVLHLLTWFFSEKCHFKGFESGQYGSPPSINYWARQATVYVFSLMLMKLLVVALFAAWPGIFGLADWMLGFLGTSDAIQVIFTMGVFPIMMNIIQFWLIDSIVKSSQASSLALPTNTPRSSMDPDAEPLFRGSSDDDDDDDRTLARHDIENPHVRSRSHSRDADAHSALGEPKSHSSGTTTIAGSGSTTPAPKPVDIGGAAVAMHAYPPSLASASPGSSPASSILSSVSSRTKSSSTSPKPSRRRRSPPPSLSLHTSPVLARAVNEVHVASPAAPRVPSKGSAVELGEVHNEKEWAAWEDEEGDNWAERVGEEEWTGRRLAATKSAVNDVWSQHIPAPDRVS
ncbi:vacuolar membrane protein-domain-containing protein [Amylocystis lapponica]|nr:vacuolar membrane protein-domain-containing protein [Amylocystis lapponica]